MVLQRNELLPPRRRKAERKLPIGQSASHKADFGSLMSTSAADGEEKEDAKDDKPAKKKSKKVADIKKKVCLRLSMTFPMLTRPCSTYSS